ncbi:MAG TPA: carboxynorspermidine decarboxylase, partial [Alphaproteobacteria bacterium]
MTDIVKTLSSVQTPAYIADEALLRQNLAALKAVKDATGVQIIYAIKACPLYPLFPIIAEVLDGSTASGPYEAKLGHDHFGKEVHVFCPAYAQSDIDQLLAIGGPIHFYFNSVHQLHKFEPQIRAASKDHAIGIRINPRISVTKYEKYNPCRQGSHLGVPIDQLDTVPWDKVDILHAHALCENMGADSALLIQTIAEKAAEYVRRVKYVNFGGGHFISHPDYHPLALIHALNHFKAEFPSVQMLMEPGGAIVQGAGYIVAKVIETVEVDGVKTAILDASPNCHVPDVIKTDLQLPVVGGDEDTKNKPFVYTLAARTCMARDLWGTYGFEHDLKEGDTIVFKDGLQYSLGEANWFNGHQRPSLGILRVDGNVEVFKSFGYK